MSFHIFEGTSYAPEGSLGGSDGKVFACNAGDPGLIPGSVRSPGEGNGNPLQYSCLENSMDEPGRLQSMGSQGIGHDWATSLSFFLSFFLVCSSFRKWKHWFKMYITICLFFKHYIEFYTGIIAFESAVKKNVLDVYIFLLLFCFCLLWGNLPWQRKRKDWYHEIVWVCCPILSISTYHYYIYYLITSFQ